jgi:hypothetical protein
VYYTTMLGIPLANGAYKGADFLEYSLFVLLIPMALILPIALFRYFSPPKLSLKSPNRKVGDFSRRPTSGQSNGPPGIPQPARLGIFHSSLRSKTAGRPRNPRTGRLGNSGRRAGCPLVGWCERSPTSRLGDSGRCAGCPSVGWY